MSSNSTNTTSVGVSSVDDGSTFYSNFFDAWVAITIWTILFTSLIFFAAGVYAVYLNMRYTPEDNAIRVKNKYIQFLSLSWIPILTCIIGSGIGFSQGTISAALVSSIASSIPYAIGVDIAAGLGISQGIIIIYFHLGRADFIHR
jgi:hypothetical protein